MDGWVHSHSDFLGIFWCATGVWLLVCYERVNGDRRGSGIYYCG